MIAHDSGYKRLFSHPEMIRDLLIGFVREPWIAELDFATLEKYPGEVIDDRLRPRRNDVIWRLRCGPDWLYVYVLLEFQSGVHPFMAARLSTYLDLLYQDLIRGRQLGRRRRLPPVLPLVLYNGRRRWTAPTDLADLIEPGPAGLDAYRPRLRYLLIDESAYTDIQLAPMRNLAAALFRLENSQGPEPVRAVLTALVEWLADPEQMELRRSFVIWLHEAFFKTRLPAVQFPELSNLEEIRIMLTDRVLDWTQQWKQEGLQQGRQEGRQEGLHSERQLLLRLVRRRFSDDAMERSRMLLAQIENPAVLEELGEMVLDCADGEAWLARLNAAVGEDRN
jgi:predicted transposase/invertase (TIGR01784 family)